MARRKGIAMIELIFAIVVIGIVLMSVPNLVWTAGKSGYVGIQQEAINEAASHLNMIWSYPWDERDTDEKVRAPILHVSAAADSNLSEYGDSGRRICTPLQSQRSFIRADGAELDASTALGLESGESKGDEDDLDDFNGEIYHLTLIETSPGDYVEKGSDIDISTSVRYLNDTPGDGSYEDPGGDKDITFAPPASSFASSSNIKEIQVTLTSQSGVEELNKTIVLKAFSCNIGETDLEERHF